MLQLQFQKERYFIDSNKAVANCSGLFILSQYFDTGLKQSFADISWVKAYSVCSSRGEAVLFENSLLVKEAGILFIVAEAAAVIMLVAPGPIEVVHVNACSLFFIFEMQQLH